MTISSRYAFFLCAARSGLFVVMLLTGLCGALLDGSPGQYVKGGMVLAGEPITSNTSSFYIEVSVNFVPEGWVFEYPDTTEENEVTLGIKSNGIWQLSVSDENTLETNGKMTEYCNGEYTSTKLNNFLMLFCAGIDHTLQYGGVVILAGNSTLEYPNSEKNVTVPLSQKVVWEDVVREGCIYQIVLTFKGEAGI